MDPRALLETYALPIASFGAVSALLVAWLVARRAERRRARRVRSPSGPGVALALALDGDLDEAKRVLAGRVRAGGADAVDALVGLVAVLKARGESQKARALLDRLAARSAGPAPWLDAMRLRLALDAGRLDDACRLVDGRPDVPMEMALAALCRAGRWADALRRYRTGVSRRQRDPHIEAALAAGCAAELERAGHGRSARRAIKRALALDPQGVLPLAVAASLHPRDADRHRFARLLGERLPGHRAAEAPVRDDVREALRLDAAGRREEALGRLRDLLEAEPRAWDVRRLYARWIVESGGPDDWRVELAEIVGLLAADDGPPPVECVACGFVAADAFAICPRCDAIGSIRAVERRGDEPPRGTPSAAGTSLSHLIPPARAGDEEGPSG